MRRVAAVLSLLTVLLLTALLGGCWDQRQISDLAVVMGVGIDIEPPAAEDGEENIVITVELARITAENTDGTPVLVTADGPTMGTAVRNLTQSLNQKLHWSHMQFLLIGEEAARRGLDRYLSLFYNNKDMSPHIYFAVYQGKAAEALGGQAGLSPYVSSGLHDILVKQRQDSNGYIYPISLQTYMSEHVRQRCGMLVPLVAKLPSSAECALYFKAMAVLDGDNKYVSRLMGVENSGASLWLNKTKNFTVALTEPNMQQKVTVELTSWRAKQEWQVGPMPWQLKLTLLCQAEGILVDEQEATHYNDKATIEHLEKLFSAELQRQLDRTWRRSIYAEVDFLGFGTQLYRHYPDQWDRMLPEWPNMMKAVRLHIQIDSKINVAGQSR